MSDRFRRVVMALCAAAVVVLGAACSNGSGSEATGEPGNAADADRVIELETTDELRFSPATISVEAGETVEFQVTNAASSDHEFVLGSGEGHSGNMDHSEPNATGAIEPGSTASIVWTFTESGEVGFACYIAGHNEQGMTGTVTISG